MRISGFGCATLGGYLLPRVGRSTCIACVTAISRVIERSGRCQARSIMPPYCCCCCCCCCWHFEHQHQHRSSAGACDDMGGSPARPLWLSLCLGISYTRLVINIIFLAKCVSLLITSCVSCVHHAFYAHVLNALVSFLHRDVCRSSVYKVFAFSLLPTCCWNARSVM